MYNCLFKYLTENNILYDKQFGIRNSHSTEHTIIELVDKLFFQFEKNIYKLGIFVDLPKAFETVYHQIVFKKRTLYSVTGNNYSWFEDYLSN